jgi:hypothetical protein
VEAERQEVTAVLSIWTRHKDCLHNVKLLAGTILLIWGMTILIIENISTERCHMHSSDLSRHFRGIWIGGDCVAGESFLVYVPMLIIGAWLLVCGLTERSLLTARKKSAPASPDRQANGQGEEVNCRRTIFVILAIIGALLFASLYLVGFLFLFLFLLVVIPVAAAIIGVILIYDYLRKKKSKS